MTSKEFISERMNRFLAKFRNARVRYQFDELGGTHFVEIVPGRIHDSDEFLDWECDMIDEFTGIYPAEGICFLSESSAVKIEKAEWILYGEEYAITSQGHASSKMVLEGIMQMPEIFTVFSSVTTPVANCIQRFNMSGNLTSGTDGNDYLLAA